VKGYSIVTIARDPAPTYPAGRTCAHDGCGTMLSVYNPAPYCALHESEHEGEHEGEDRVPDGYRRCRVCGRVLPATSEHFHRVGRNRRTGEAYANSLHTACKACRNHRNRRDKPLAPPPEHKRCPKCGIDKRLDRHNFYWNTYSSSYSSWCKVCTRDAARIRARLKSGVGA